MSVYSSLLENVLWPCHNLFRNRHYVRHRRFLEKSQWWSTDKLLALQWREASALLRHALKSVPYYQRKFRDAGIRAEDIRGWDDWRRLPVLSREEVNAHRSELCARDFPEKLSPHATGGSSGVPTRFYITNTSYDWRTAATQRVYAWSGCTLGERAAYLWGAPVGQPPVLKALKLKAFETLQRQLIINTFLQTPERWRAIYDQLRRFKPRLLVGYVSSLQEFSRFVLRSGLPPIGVAAVIAAAEPLDATVRKEIEDGAGAPVFNTYGSREFMSIAGECHHHSGLHVNVENILVETADAQPGLASEFLITDLHNYGMPFIRYRIGDIGSLDFSPCSCGRGLPRIRSIEGRVLDVLRSPDGRIIPGELFPHVLKDIPEIAEYQIHQKSPDRIVICVVLSSALSESSASLLDNEMKKVCGNELKVELKPVTEIPHLASGKRRVTIGLS